MGRPRRRQQRGAFYGEPNGLQPGDDVGNRRSLRQTQHPPDDIGNRAETAESLRIPEDNIGNRIDAAPTHEVSGVLADIDGRRRRKKKGGQHQRVGRYIMGGVNPVVAGHPERAIKALEEADQRRYEQRNEQRHEQRGERPPEQRPENAVNGQGPAPQGLEGDEEGRRGRRRRRRRRDGREQVDGVAAQEVSERRAQRFFDFEEDDRFEYVLKSPPESKRKDAEHAVRSVLETSARDAVVLSRVLDDGERPKVLITIDERGPSKELPEARRPDNASEPLFVLGNAALMSLNYLANKIVNRYPDDRIRLAILPKADEELYLKSLAEHRAQHPQGASAAATANGAAGAPAPASAEAAPVSGDNAEAPAPVPEDEPAAEAAPKKKAARARPRAKDTVAQEEAPEAVDAVEVTAAPVEDAGAEEAGAEEPEAAPKKKAAAKKTAKVAKTAKTAKVAKKAPATKTAAAKTPAKKVVAKKATKKAPAKKTTSKAKPASKKDDEA